MTPEEEKLEGQRKLLLASYQRVFAGEDGRRVLEHLKQATNFHCSHFARCGKHDPVLILIEEARRELVLEIINNVELKPDDQGPLTAITEKE